MQRISNMSVLKPVMETKRLILRNIDMKADIDMWHDMMTDEDTVRYIGGKTFSRAQTWRYMAMCLGHQQVRGYGFFSVIEKATGDWVGRIGPWYPEGWVAPEIGWGIHRHYTGRGFAKEAAKACVDYAFDVLEWDQVVHMIIEGNIGSEKTAEAIGSKRLYKVDGIAGVTDLPSWVYGQDNPNGSAHRDLKRSENQS